MERYTNANFEKAQNNLGMPRPPSSYPAIQLNPPKDRDLEAKIFATEPELTDAEWNDPQKILIRIRTQEVGLKIFTKKLKSFNENCKIMRANLDDEQKALNYYQTYSALMGIGRLIMKRAKVLDERVKERDLLSQKYEDFIKSGYERMDSIIARGRERNNPAWWLEKPWYAEDEFYHSEQYYEREL